MIKKLLFAASLLLLLASCHNNKNVPNTNIDVARAFIRDILDNDFKSAEPFLLPGDMNKEYFDLSQKQYNNLSSAELDNYKNSDILVKNIDNLNDSTTIINYSNTYKKEDGKLRMVRVNGQWLVDLQYTFKNE